MKQKDLSFRRTVWKHFRTQGRHQLPWRVTKNPYRILVSEIMLQQTQVDRVISFYESWIRAFPSAHVLANAPLSTVLRAWQGLGYNRRAKMLRLAAKEIKRRGAFPKTIESLESLPGVGPYTARAVAAFAYNQDSIFIETNIRTAILHHFFPHKKKVHDDEVRTILLRLHPKGRAREWYAALMDYGAHLKRSGVRINAKSKTYTKQSVFRGSAREARGAILTALVKGPKTGAYLKGILGPDRKAQVEAQLLALKKEGMLEYASGKYRLPA